ncbi:hypothetical protein P8C59_008093 [Phyllachora maydis]|uniref:Uncharacterized protein n=2 Tax=Phyllachora maydis TaxID=1825666 RepID=A0AAD9MEV3_9PEZI|nr:hypothetical protein P8C59_008093 [Phyllachora maydis]
MQFSTSAPSTLTRPRVSIALISAVATATVGYLLYRVLCDPLLSEPAGGQRLHRSNAVRHRRRALTDPHGQRDRERRDSTSSAGSPSTSHGDGDGDGGDENNDATIRPLADGETVADEQVLDNDWWNEPGSQPPHQRAGQNIVSLLFRVSEDNARRNAYVHRGCECNACGISPIRGIRYRCANCADFDLCETCESQGLHIKTHIFYKVKVPAPRFGPRQMQPVWYSGDPETCLRSLPRGVIAKLSRETGFERPELEAFWEQWTFMANTEWREDPDDLCLAMDRKTFGRCLVPCAGFRYAAPHLLHDRMFAFYDTNNDDLISFREFLLGLSYRKQRDKLKKIFQGYDIDRDGYVSRRDFLRIFRAYYVLFKQMHKDILDGLDDQVMSSAEVHHLVSSRQPLSSLFGRENRVPEADRDRPMEGKMFHCNGEVTVSDGKNGVVNEDRADTSDREAILSNLYARDSAADFAWSPLFPPSPRSSGPADSYWSAVLNPPTRLDELPELLAHPMTRLGEETSDDQQEARVNGVDLPRRDENSAEDETCRENLRPRPGRADAPPSEAVTDRVPTESQLWARHQRRMKRKNRAIARRKLLDRWRRRQFYLDEEEGATPPDGWDDSEDILNGLNGMPESSKAAQAAPISPRSRSSSKVRFAEDTEDYEVRSNPSTSSRSVPERWGGMDIPDAERDAGKEILYQVTQQAFNELLDVLFRAKEDLTIQAVQSRQERDKYRHLFQHIDLGEMDRKRREHEATGDHDRDHAVRDTTLSELLRTSGHTVDDLLTVRRETPGVMVEISEEVVDGLDGDKTGPYSAAPFLESCETPPAPASSLTEGRDPTMPQFRPDSAMLPETDRPGMNGHPSSSSSHSYRGPTEADRQRVEASIDPKTNTTVTSQQLIAWKRLDMADQEAMQRGGWGRLSYQEFEEIYKVEEGEGNRIDYLGSWIDFCLP